MQQIVWLDTETGPRGQQRLAHRSQAEQFYRELEQKGINVRVGIKTTGPARRFKRLLSELNMELWIGGETE